MSMVVVTMKSDATGTGTGMHRASHLTSGSLCYLWAATANEAREDISN